MQHHSIPSLLLPDPLVALLREGAECAISVSGGKDSQAMLTNAANWFRAQGFPGRLFAIWANLGRAERSETPDFLAGLCARVDVPLETVRPVVGGVEADLQASLGRRKEQLTGQGAPFWPTRGLRYCTSLKRDACDKRLRRAALIVSLEGIRAEESDERAEKAPWTVRASITSARYRTLSPQDAWSEYCRDRVRLSAVPVQESLFDVDEDATCVSSARTGGRLALTLYPLFFWSQAEVWEACGTSLAEVEERRALYREGIEREDSLARQQALSGWPAHPAYVKGANRLSCSLCILGDEATLRTGAYDSPAYYRQLVWWEIESGYPFQQQRWLADVAPTLLTEEQRVALEQLPQRRAWLEKSRRRKVLPLYTGTAAKAGTSWGT